MRTRAERLGVHTVEAGPGGGSIEFKETTPVDPLTLVSLIQSDPGCYKLTGANRLSFKRSLPAPSARHDFVQELLGFLAPESEEIAANA